MRTRVAWLVAAALCLASCGGLVTAAPTPTAPQPAGTSAVARAQATHEYPSAAAPLQHSAGGAPTAAAAVVAFATAYINWSARTVAGDMRSLAARSIGQARAAMQLAAAQTASDYELQHGGVANTGTVEAVAPLRGSPDEYAVVTREQTTATATAAYQGLQPAWHVAIASVSREGNDQWVVSGWQPEN